MDLNVFFREHSRTVPNWEFSLLLRGDYSVFMRWIEGSPFLADCLQRRTCFIDYRAAPKFLKRAGKPDRENRSCGCLGVEKGGITQDEECCGDFSLLFFFSSHPSDRAEGLERILLPWGGPSSSGAVITPNTTALSLRVGTILASQGSHLAKELWSFHCFLPAAYCFGQLSTLCVAKADPGYESGMLEQGIPIVLPPNTCAFHCLDLLKESTSSSGSLHVV